MNHATFFAGVRTSAQLFDGRLTTGQVAGMESILEAWEASGLTDLRWLAYMLATAFHETGRSMQPIIETRQPTEAANPSVDKAIARLESSWKRGVMPWVKSAYWRKDPSGKSWLGRGLVQLTHKANYAKMSVFTGVDLVAEPDRAMDTAVAVKIMFEGMTRGVFTGKKLSDYFSSRAADWEGARRIINGTDKAFEIARYGYAFHDAVRAAA